MDEAQNGATPDAGPASVHELDSYRGDGAAPVLRLAVSDALFKATGVARVKTTWKGKERWLHIPIHAVEIEDVEKVVGSRRPRCPTYRDKVGNKWVTIQDEANAEYLAAVSAFQHLMAKTWVLLAIDVDIFDAGEVVVWSADNTVQQLEPAIEALRKQGMVDNQLMTIFREVQALTEDAQEAYSQD